MVSHDVSVLLILFFFFFFKQKTAYEMRISDWSSDVCSSDLAAKAAWLRQHLKHRTGQRTPERRRAERWSPGAGRAFPAAREDGRRAGVAAPAGATEAG